MRQSHVAGARDVAVQKLRDMTIAVAVVAAAGVGVIAWISAATIPGSTGTSSLIGNTTTRLDDGRRNSRDDGFAQAPPAQSQTGSGVAVSGGSHP